MNHTLSFFVVNVFNLVKSIFMAAKGKQRFVSCTFACILVRYSREHYVLFIFCSSHLTVSCVYKRLARYIHKIKIL